MPSTPAGTGSAGTPVAPPAADAGDATPDDAQVPVDAADAAPDPTCGRCAHYAAPVLRANVGVTSFAEISGAAFSRRNADVLYAHNDRARPDIVALTADGNELAQIRVAGVSVSDVEDMAVAPCPAGTCVYLADFGDNAAVRGDYAILRFPEPELGSAAGAIDVEAESSPFGYEDGSHNAESLLVTESGEIYVVTKLAAGQASSVYAIPAAFGAGTPAVATKVADLPVPAADDDSAVGASAHPCGLGFLLRTYDGVYELPLAAGRPFVEAFAATPVPIPGANEPQSEAIAYFPDGRGFITTGEGASAPIFETACAP